jgi:DNA repair exonuclease SbcCD ATPase subunit
MEPQRSDVRALGGADPDAHAPFELGTGIRERAALQPPPLALSDALDQYGSSLPASAGVQSAVEVGDLPRAMVQLLQRIHALTQELEASRSDFEELHAVNLSIQSQMDEALAVADEQRLQLIEQLERTHDAVFELENNIAQDRVVYEGELERCRAERDALEAELRELRDEFSDYQARLWK